MKQVQVRTSGSSEPYQNLINKWGSDWEMANAPQFPLDINIQGADGDSVSTNIYMSPDQAKYLMSSKGIS